MHAPVRVRARHCLQAALALLLYVVCLGPCYADFANSRAWYNSQSTTEKGRIQNSLFWTGDYNIKVDAIFGPETYNAVRRFQRRTAGPKNGVLTRQQSTLLREEARRLRQLITRRSKVARTSGQSSKGQQALRWQVTILP